ncbi:hypothetical protein QZH41_020135, partial [Actinostola sp. cb2023]
ILLAAKQLKCGVRVCGAGHSPSDIVCTSDFLISLNNYNRVLKIDKENKQVTVQAGLLLTDLHGILDDNGLGFSNLGALSDFTCAGVISTCVHGSGADYGLLATLVVSLELLTVDGEIVECSRTKNQDIFLTTLCGLGAMGVILSVTWQCEPAFNLHEKTKSCSLDEMLDNLDQEVSSCQHFKFLWYPHTGKVTGIYLDRTSKPPTPPQSSWFWDWIFGFYLLEFLYWLSSFLPSLVPYINKLYFKKLFQKSKQRIDKSYKVFNFNCLFKQHVTEWAIGRDKTAYVLRRLRDWTESSGCNVHFPVEVRFVKSDDIYLSPCYEKDVTFINIISYRPYGKDIPHDQWWNFYEELMTSVGGVPHWAKAHNFTASNFEKLYPKFSKVCQLCEELDPEGTFRNQYVNRVLFE